MMTLLTTTAETGHESTKEVMFAPLLWSLFSPNGKCWMGPSCFPGAAMQVLPKEGFTPQDALRVLPENNELVGVRVRGVDLLSEIEKGLVDYYIHGDKDAYPHTAGLKYKLDLEQPAGRRIQNAKLLGFGCNWKPLKENDSYMILTDSVVADSVFSGRALAKSPSGVGETEALWRFASKRMLSQGQLAQDATTSQTSENPIGIVGTGEQTNGHV
jgi:hypothetical protein